MNLLSYLIWSVVGAIVGGIVLTPTSNNNLIIGDNGVRMVMNMFVGFFAGGIVGFIFNDFVSVSVSMK